MVTHIAVLYAFCSGTDACQVDKPLDLEIPLSSLCAVPMPDQGSPGTEI